MEPQFVQVGDLSIHYDLTDYTEPWRTDRRETVLLYSGYCRTMEFWRAWIPLLGRHYRVLRMDSRGYGLTTKPPRGSTITTDMLVDDAVGLLNSLGIERVHWVGESTGGSLGLMAALKYPERVSSITLCNAFAKMSPQTISTYALGESDQAAAIEKYGVAEWCLRTLQYRMDVARAPPGIGEWMAREMAKTPTHIAVAAFKLFSTFDITPRLPEVRQPTLLIVGSKCSSRLKQHLSEMRDRLKRAKLVELEGFDYGIHFLAPDAVVAELRQFLRDMGW